MQDNSNINLQNIRLNTNNDIQFERNIWLEYFIKIFVMVPSICYLCGNTKITVYQNNSLANPFIGRCTNCHCRKYYYLRDKTFFSLFPKTIVSTILYIMKLWILEKKNAVEIYHKIKIEAPNLNLSLDKIREILMKLRYFIAHYLKDTYILEDISQPNEFHHFAIDESDFTKIDGSILWVIGIINTHNKLLRLQLSFNRDAETMKKIISCHVKPGNIIVSDGWGAYQCLDQP